MQSFEFWYKLADKQVRRSFVRSFLYRTVHQYNDSLSVLFVKIVNHFFQIRGSLWNFHLGNTILIGNIAEYILVDWKEELGSKQNFPFQHLYWVKEL